MQTALIVTTYNRPKYLRECLDSLKRLNTAPDILLISDDNSTDEETIELINTFSLNSSRIVYNLSPINKKIYGSLKDACTLAINNGAELLINLDSDAIVRNDFIEKIKDVCSRFPDQIVTGFNCKTKNNNGTERHPILFDSGEDWNTKRSVGGVNMAFNVATYKKYIEPALSRCIANKGNWDAMACINSMNDNKPIVCIQPSIVQHIGVNSSMGHGLEEKPDTADDFKMLYLPDITLIGVDCVGKERLQRAADASCKDIEFGDVVLLTDVGIKSKEQYSEFVIKELTKYVKTKYALVIQYDGYVVNAAAWSNDFYQYDYIGATWWYRDGCNVGNGGFSLRSKKLLDICATDKVFKVHTHPEDDVICRRNGRYLQSIGIRFAPEWVAKKFSVEGYRQKDNQYTNQFGFHGTHILKQLQPQQKKGGDVIVLSQYFGLGDILFCIPIARHYIAKGHKVVWAVNGNFVDLNKHFPDITFIDTTLLNVNHEVKTEQQLNGARVIPLRWSDQIMKRPFKEVMRNKYDMLGLDWRMWRKCEWVRDTANEEKLFSEVLGLKKGEKYNLINTRFRTNESGHIKIDVKNNYRNVEMRTIDGYTLLDWGKVIENATTIHTVSTSINYVIELLTTKAEQIHLYVRKPDERDFSFIDYLLTKNYVRHL